MPTPRLRFYGDRTYDRTYRQCRGCGELVILEEMNKRGPNNKRPDRSVEQRIDQRCNACHTADRPVQLWENLPKLARRISLR